MRNEDKSPLSKIRGPRGHKNWKIYKYFLCCWQGHRCITIEKTTCGLHFNLLPSKNKFNVSHSYKKVARNETEPTFFLLLGSGGREGAFYSNWFSRQSFADLGFVELRFWYTDMSNFYSSKIRVHHWPVKLRPIFKWGFPKQFVNNVNCHR